MRKPNYSLERKDRERAKQAKAAAKMEKRAAKGAGVQRDDASNPQDQIGAGEAAAREPRD